MDKKQKNQIIIIIIGLLLMFTGFYFFYLRIEYIITSLVSITGLVLLISGIRYKQRANRKKLTGDERSAYVRSAYFITTMIGAVILFIGLGGAALANYMHATASASWLLIVIFVGMLLIIAGRIVKAADDPKKT